MEVIQDDLLYQETSQAFVGQWNKLVSTTNWEKGRIILHWRQELIARGAPVAEYSDEAWSRRVGNVSPQHVGRLRRVAERFGDSREEFAGLYWSHFQATLDWEDAEMWLEGAVQNGWSVSQMKHQRWEALGAPEELKPREEDILSGELDEDVDPEIDDAPHSTVEALVGVVQGASDEPAAADEFDSAAYDADEVDDGDGADEVQGAVASYDELQKESAAQVRPFQNLPSLPEDLAEVVESFKLSILRHKMLDWEEISCDDLLAVLDALKALAVAPSEA